MYSAYHDHNAADWHDRDFDRFRRDEARRHAVVSEKEITPPEPDVSESEQRESKN